MNNLEIAFKTITQLGLKYGIYYGVYRLGLISGHYRRIMPANFYLPIADLSPEKVQWPIDPPEKKTLQNLLSHQQKDLLAEVDENLNSRVRLFGGPAVHLSLTPPGELSHWTDYELGKAAYATQDVKLIWEPARLGWAFTLARAYLVSSNEDYAKCFWRLFEEFTASNPFNSGPNWTSAQEAALRIIALTFAGSIFRKSANTDEDRLLMLLASIYLHAKRIPPTLWYARAQNNNHLLTEAIGLYTAGCFFTDLPEAHHWKTLGWRWFNKAIQDQIADNGEYTQHSTNYHRLMLHAALWMDFISRNNGEKLPDKTINKLSTATEWLLAYIDPTTGRVPNLGHNDGSNILPLSQCPYADFRPVAQTASRAFLNKASFPPGTWDEPCVWLKLPTSPNPVKKSQPDRHADVLWIGFAESRAYLQAIQYRSRPAHADQLHADFWFNGYNLALDAGTYLYNAPSPWENALAGTGVHNTIAIDRLDQMQRASKFLWLDWAQGQILKLDRAANEIFAEHNGYRHLGITHKRNVKYTKPTEWQVTDYLEPRKTNNRQYQACLHWLLPDWPWRLNDSILTLEAPFGKVKLTISNSDKKKPEIDLIRAGKSLFIKKTSSSIRGWSSPTYDYKIPALSLVYSIEFSPTLRITTRWQIIEK